MGEEITTQTPEQSGNSRQTRIGPASADSGYSGHHLKAKKINNNRHTNKYASQFESEVMHWLLSRPLVGVAVHWTFQNMLYMDPTERRFKLLLDLALAIVAGSVLSARLSWQIAWPTALLVAHTLNFLFNGQLWVLLKHYGLVNHTYEAFESYIQDLDRRAQGEPAIHYIAIYGSLSRQQWSRSSDLDARIVRYPGFVNGLRASWFLLRERSRALIAGFPLDAYIIDNRTSLRKLNPEESPIYLCDRTRPSPRGNS